jgi:2-isopropylmalate synthase
MNLVFTISKGGWPGSNPKDMAFFDKAKTNTFQAGKNCGVWQHMPCRQPPENDPNLQALIEAETPAVSIFGKSWLLHVTQALKITPEKNLEMISGSIKYLKKHGKEVIYDAEHFFDGYKDDPGYAIETLLPQNRPAPMFWFCVIPTAER